MVAQDVEKLKATFGDHAFSGSDVARVLGRNTHGTGGIFKFMINRGEVIRIRPGAYQFVANPKDAQIKAESAPVNDQPPAPTTPSLVRIGELYLHERLLLVADTARQEASDAVRLYTTIIEVDPATKHPRNKIINFIKARDPREYAQARAWIDSLAGDPHPADDTALELAADLERQLNAARKENADLKAKLDAIRGAL